MKKLAMKLMVLATLVMLFVPAQAAFAVNTLEDFKGMSGKVIHAEFKLDGQKFIALDGGPDFRFSEAISFTIECVTQAEIDYYWEKLSHEPEAEQCGWVRDQFGLSWQIVPHNMGELQQTEKQITAMMNMKKIIIRELEDAGID